jgi:hypothetical protein
MISGVRTDIGEEIYADLIVDAPGRTSLPGSWPTAPGARPMVERRSDCGLLQYSRHFRFRDGVEIPRVPALLRGPRGDISYLAFAVFIEDSRTFAPVLMIPPWDRELRALRSGQGYGRGPVGARACAVVLIERAQRIACDNAPPAPAGPSRTELLNTIAHATR